ncbi:hypothetical protein [Xanthocytophaga agilis]|uniref:Conjugative transposon protein TraK n=1 Tax=Xanthocytophaga agilis TaxID=3048010 RepID=A0AAE3R7M0_9BACT|nr:hypothetical protein [Xanthocytophaga agilis]MDJ1505229.1 hypothetical protein [Xanthocytophaga agilis]
MKAPDFDKTLKTTQRIATVSLLLLVVSNLLWSFIYFSAKRKGEERVYVVSDNTTLAASLASNYKPTIYEGKNHVRNFMTLMHSHDASNYADRINAALKLIDKQVGARLYNKMKQGGILEHYTRFNSRTEMEIDSVNINMSVEPYKGAIYARQKYLYDNESEIIPIAADFDMIRTHRSDANPFGLQITNFDYKAYNPPVEK